jgi:hypothetical protein
MCFIKLFSFKDYGKKNDAGVVAFWTQFVGVFVTGSNDSNAKIAGFYLQTTAKNKRLKIGLYGLKNGYLNGRLIKLYQETAVTASIHFSEHFIHFLRAHLSLKLSNATQSTLEWMLLTFLPFAL